MEIRRIQRTGGSTYTVSLPKQWADRLGITSGTNVGISARPDGALIITPATANSSVLRKKLDVTGKTGEPLIREIVASYIAGFNVIELTSNRITVEQKQTIRQIIHKLIGPEIMEETADRMIIQDLLNPSELSLRQSVRRMFLIAISMHNDAMHALAFSDKELALDVAQRDDEVDRLYLLIEKQLRSMLRRGQIIDSQKDLTPDMSLDLSLAAHPVERIADHARKIALSSTNIGEKLPAHVIRMFEEAGQDTGRLVECASDSLFSSDIELANRTIGMKENVGRVLRAIDRKLISINPGDALHLRIVSDSLDRICDYGTNVAEIAINSTISRSV